MAQGGNLGQRITDLIGAIYSNDVDYEGDLINAATVSYTHLKQPTKCSV